MVFLSYVSVVKQSRLAKVKMTSISTMALSLMEPQIYHRYSSSVLYFLCISLYYIFFLTIAMILCIFLNSSIEIKL